MGKLLAVNVDMTVAVDLMPADLKVMLEDYLRSTLGRRYRYARGLSGVKVEEAEVRSAVVKGECKDSPLGDDEGGLEFAAATKRM